MITAMQDLKEDLQHTIDTANEALMEINDVVIRKACQKTVEITLKNIVKRIDDELLTMEKGQIIEAVQHGLWNNEVVDMAYYSKIYYENTFNDNVV